MDAVTSQDLSAFRRLRQRVVAMSNTPYALWALAAVAVIDGSIFPIPPFALLIPMVLAQPKKGWLYASVGTVSSLFGGALGYALGYGLRAGLMTAMSVDPNLPVHFGYGSWVVDTTLAQLLTNNFWFLALAASFSPLPYKVVAIGSGLVGVAIPAFALASLIGRPIRFFLVTLAFVFFGEKAAKYLK